MHIILVRGSVCFQLCLLFDDDGLLCSASLDVLDFNISPVGSASFDVVLEIYFVVVDLYALAVRRWM